MCCKPYWPFIHPIIMVTKHTNNGANTSNKDTGNTLSNLFSKGHGHISLHATRLLVTGKICLLLFQQIFPFVFSLSPYPVLLFLPVPPSICFVPPCVPNLLWNNPLPSTLSSFIVHLLLLLYVFCRLLSLSFHFLPLDCFCHQSILIFEWEITYFFKDSGHYW